MHAPIASPTLPNFGGSPHFMPTSFDMERSFGVWKSGVFLDTLSVSRGGASALSIFFVPPTNGLTTADVEMVTNGEGACCRGSATHCILRRAVCQLSFLNFFYYLPVCHAVVLYLLECTFRQTFFPPWSGTILVF